MATPYSPYTAPGPPTYRISIWFSQQGDLLGGWSENFWSTAASQAIAVQQAMGLQAALLFSKGTTIWSPFIRISQVGGFRQVQVIRSPATSNPAANNAVGSVVPGVKALIPLISTQGLFTRQWFGGLPYTSFNPSGTWYPTQGQITSINAVITFLAQNGFVIRKVASGNPKVTISAITQAGVVTATAHGLPAAAKVRIGRVVPGLGVDGLWTITVMDANTFSLNGLNPPGFTAVPQLTKSSYVQLYQWTIYNIAPLMSGAASNQYSFIRATTHKIGRPPAQYSGRRKKRAS